MIDHIIFDITDADTRADTHQIGAIVQGVRSSAKQLINSQQISATEWLQVAAALHAGDGTAIGQTGGSLDVNVTNSLGIDVDLDHTEDSVRLGDGTSFFTSTSENSDIALDVHISNTSIAVTQSTSPWVVSATDLDIRDLTQTDEVTVYQGTDPWVIGDGGNSITVDASDLDIRDLTAASDSVESWTNDGAGNPIGSHTGALDVYMTNTLTVNDSALANTAIAHAKNTLGADDTAEDVVASPLANRKYLWIYNNGNKKLYIGASGVDAATGFPVSPGAYVQMRAGASIDVEWVASTAGHDMRHLELS